MAELTQYGEGNFVIDPTRKFYVSAQDNSRYKIVRGPFTTHEKALDAVESTKNLVFAIDAKAHFYAWGTCSAPIYEKIDGVWFDEHGKMSPGLMKALHSGQ